MGLEQQITSDMKDAMRAGDTLRRDTLRMLIAALKNERIERGEDLDEPAVMAIVRRGVKSRTDSAEQFRAADRAELADKEEAEIRLLEGYLPQMLDEAGTAELVEKAIADTGAAGKSDIGKVMKAVMATHRDVVDGKLVNRLAAERL